MIQPSHVHVIEPNTLRLSGGTVKDGQSKGPLTQGCACLITYMSPSLLSCTHVPLRNQPWHGYPPVLHAANRH